MSVAERLATGTAETAATDLFVQRIPRLFARTHLVLGVEADRDQVELLTAESTPRWIVGNVCLALQKGCPTRVVDAADLAERIEEAYNAVGDSDGGALEKDSGKAGSEGGAADDLLASAGKSDTVRLVDAVLFDASRRRASDVHFQPTERGGVVRLRVDGTLVDARSLDRAESGSAVARLKVMGGMDVAERRVPQDGRARVTIGQGEDARRIDLRLSSIPTSLGERVVIRLLDQSSAKALPTFEALGMPGRVWQPFLRQITQPNGIVLVTGPTGSGKTTTLYTTLRWIAQFGSLGVADSTLTESPNASDHGLDGVGDASGAGGVARESGRAANDLNIMTVEDPIEYDLASPDVCISQSQVNAKKGITFASGLRHILRQDPDVIMVGEIRDTETASLAVQASLTGHLVLSTLHTNDAPSAVVRLLDLGIERYLVTSSLNAVLSQRLVRLIHPDCGGRGCPGCSGSGYSGRSGIFELLVLDDALRTAVHDSKPWADVLRAAEAIGYRPMRDHGEDLINAGITTRREVHRVVEWAGVEDES